MLIIEDVSYRYKVREDATLKHVCLHVAKGEMLLLAGRSGCGKSTLIKAVSGLLNTAGAGELYGKIYLDGNDTAFMKRPLLSAYHSPITCCNLIPTL